MLLSSAVVMTHWLLQHWQAVLTVLTTVGGYLLAFALIVRIVDERKEAAATLAWILLIAFLPYLGALLYVTLGRRRVRRRSRRRRLARGLLERGPDACPHHREGCTSLVREDSAQLDEVAIQACRVAGEPFLAGNAVDVYLEANRAYRHMIEAIDGARHHVHLMSYIFRPDQAGRLFVERLQKKAAQGVEVRLLVDAVGSHRLPDSFLAPLLAAGGRFARFMPVFSLRPVWRPQLRNHRKLLVVDGRVAFTGGLNIGAEYQGRKKKYAPWRDTQVRVEGPACWRLQEVFVDDWFFASGENLQDRLYWEGFTGEGSPGENLVQVVESGPDRERDTIHAVFFSAVCAARHRIYITTPYLVPDNAMLTAIKTAAWRGVDVRLLLPGKSDLSLVKWAGRSFYRELLEAGVRLYEHSPGILHAKTMVVDGSWCTVGSANLDIRSFRLNFEVNVVVSGGDFAGRMERIFRDDISRADELTLEKLSGEPRLARFTASLCRVLSPVL